MPRSGVLPRAHRDRARAIAACLAAALVGGLVYLNALDNPFVYDDRRQIDENRALQDTFDIRAVVLANITRPLVAVSYALDHAIWGATPFGFHVTNVLLHVLNVVLLFALAHRLVADRNGRMGPALAIRPGVAASVAALLLAVHPLMTQAVTYISGRSDLLMTGFLLAAFLAARRWLTRDRFGWLLATMALWAFALGSKETAIVFPLLLWLYVRMVSPPALRADHPNGLILLTITAGVLALARTAVLFGREGHGPVDLRPDLGLTQIDVLRRYLVLLVAPHGQTVFHAISPFTGILDTRLWLGVAVLGVLVGWIALVHRRVPAASFGMTWFLLALVPPAFLVLFDRGEPMAEHRAYLAGCGAFLTAGALSAWTARRIARRGGMARLAGIGALGIVTLSLAGRTVERNEVWSSRVRLWAEAASYAPQHWMPQLALGEALHDAGRHSDAVHVFERSIALRDTEPAAHLKLGICLFEEGRLADAEAAFRRLEELDSRHPAASNGMAAVAMARGDETLARHRFEQTLEIDPLNVEARQGMATLAEAAGDYDEALRRCEEIQLLAPNRPGIAACIDRNRRLAGQGGAERQ